MRIVVDMQGAQTESRMRGIGRYTLSFAQALARNRGEHEIVLALSRLFPQTIDPIKAAFDRLLPPENIRVWDAPSPVREIEPANDERRAVAELIREAFLASLQPDIVHVTSLFEGYCDDAVTSIGALHRQIPTSVTLYDLIPLRDSERFLTPNPPLKKWYLRKLDALKRANLLLAISAFSLEDARDALSAPADTLFNVSVGCPDVFRPLTFSAAERRTLFPRFGIDQPFILCSGSGEPHKNLSRLICAYARLPQSLQKTHQVVLVGKIDDTQAGALRKMACDAGIEPSGLVITGYVSDDDLVLLYNLCAVTIVPSYYEGFGLPALEAMYCGAPVIGSNVTSIPEVIGWENALFDPHDEVSIATKLKQALADDVFRATLKSRGLEQARKFSWDKTAKRALAAMESLAEARQASKVSAASRRTRPKLAYVSPLPPERTGIAEYSAELIPALAEYYDITAIVSEETVGDPSIKAHCEIRTAEWLCANAYHVGRVLYHVGNSPFHSYMQYLITRIPGTVALHDFFLGNLLSSAQSFQDSQHCWAQALYESHGYAALQASLQEDFHAAKTKYPANLGILKHAEGVIVHSKHSCQLAEQWLNKEWARDWKVIPHLRRPVEIASRAEARASLGLPQDAFIICSFGLLDPAKLNHRLLNAFMSSLLAADQRCHLIFVGQNHGGDYGAAIRDTIRGGLSKRVHITNWAEMPVFRSYLAAADIAVQLRTSSRGETSGTVLDCLNYGLATIVNAHGSLAELQRDTVWMLPDDFRDEELIAALEILWQHKERRQALGNCAKNSILKCNGPSFCAEQYRDAIEAFHKKTHGGWRALVNCVAALPTVPSDTECRKIAVSIARSLPGRRAQRKLLLDISATLTTDLKTGIERVTCALTRAATAAPPQGYRIEPVYLCCERGAWHYRYARRYTLDLLGCASDILDDEIVEPCAGDVLLGLDISGGALIEAETAGLLAEYRSIGVSVYFVIYDLLPLQMPQNFPPGANCLFEQWLQAVLRQDGAVCISRATAKNLRDWAERNLTSRPHRFHIGWFHQGADFENGAFTRGRSQDAHEVPEALHARPTFLMVGTIEPRKGHLQTLAAFDALWNEGVNVNLAIVGAEGWKAVAPEHKRTIPEILGRLRNHPEQSKRLFWFEGVSDEFLEKIYAASTCLIAASEGEGFGLPLIEAARHKLPILARDIAVFREVAGRYATYFSGMSSEHLASAIRAWLEHQREESRPKLDKMPWITWAEAVRQVCSQVCDGSWLYVLASDRQCHGSTPQPV